MLYAGRLLLNLKMQVGTHVECQSSSKTSCCWLAFRMLSLNYCGTMEMEEFKIHLEIMVQIDGLCEGKSAETLSRSCWFS